MATLIVEAVADEAALGGSPDSLAIGVSVTDEAGNPPTTPMLGLPGLPTNFRARNGYGAKRHRREGSRGER
jgi:hypothetical protein